MFGLVAKLVGIAGPITAARLEQIGRIAINKLVAGEWIPAQKAKGVTCLEAESSLAVCSECSPSDGFDGFGVAVDPDIRPTSRMAAILYGRKGHFGLIPA